MLTTRPVVLLLVISWKHVIISHSIRRSVKTAALPGRNQDWWHQPTAPVWWRFGTAKPGWGRRFVFQQWLRSNVLVSNFINWLFGYELALKLASTTPHIYLWRILTLEAHALTTHMHRRRTTQLASWRSTIKSAASMRLMQIFAGGFKQGVHACNTVLKQDYSETLKSQHFPSKLPHCF